MWHVFGCMLALLLVSQHCVQSETTEEETILDNLFNNRSYNGEIRPSNKTKLNVRVNIFIREIYSVDELKREIALQLTLRLRWRDERLSFSSRQLNYILAGPSSSGRIWRPNIFITNEKDARLHKVPADNALTRIYPNGQVQHSTRLSATVSCPVNSTWFPFGSLSCPLRLASYSREVTDLQLAWEDGGLTHYKGIDLDGYRLENSSIRSEQCVAFTKLGRFSCVSSTIRLRRLPRRWLLTLYLPGLALAACAAVCASLRRKNELVVNALCFIAAVGLSLQAVEVPSSDSLRAIDVWVVLLYGFFLLHILLLTYPKAKPGNCPNHDEQNLRSQWLIQRIEQNIRTIFYSAFILLTSIYFLVIRLCPT